MGLTLRSDLVVIWTVLLKFLVASVSRFDKIEPLFRFENRLLIMESSSYCGCMWDPWPFSSSPNFAAFGLLPATSTYPKSLGGLYVPGPGV